MLEAIFNPGAVVPHKITSERRRRRWKFGADKPIWFPAWAAWSDSRVRLDDAILDALAGMQLSRVALAARAKTDGDLVPDLFTDAELPYKNGFSVSVAVARHRLADAETQLALNAFPIYVSGFDDFLSGVIRMLRRLDIATTSSADKAAKGVASKLKFLKEHADIRVDPVYVHLYELLVEVRNSVIHGQAQAEDVLKIWNRGGAVPTAARKYWESVAEREFPAARPTGELDLHDREIVGCQRFLDRLGIEVIRALRVRVSNVDWARLVAADFGPRHPGILSDPNRGPRKLRAWCRAWQVEISEDDAKEAIGAPLKPSNVPPQTPPEGDLC